MLIYVPPIYFTGLCIYLIWTHRRIEVTAWMSFLYAISAYASIYVFERDLIGIEYGTPLKEVGIVPTLLYCGLLTLTMWPFHLMRSERIKTIEQPKKWLFYALSMLFILTFFCTAICYYPDFREVFTSDSLKAVRDVVYTDDKEGIELSGWRYLMAMPETLFSALAMLAIPFFFYSLSFMKNPWWFNVLLLIGSTTSILKSTLIAGRTQIIYWIFIFVACYLFFHQFLRTRMRFFIQLVFGIVGGLVIVMFLAITASRYNEMLEYAFEMVMLYIGEPFVYFCYFWDYFQSDLISFERLMPFTHQFILGHPVDLEVYRNKVYSESGLFIGVFFTFLGDLLIDITRLGMIIYVFVYHGVARWLLRRSVPEQMPFHQILIWFILLLVPLEGLFYYSFHTVRMGYYVVETIFLVMLFKYRFRLWHKKEAKHEPNSFEK